jgi:tetratricopeptide (TPR) repeat protein
MSKQAAIPGFFEKREMMYAEKPDQAGMKARGEALLAEGLLDGALELFQRAGHAAGLEKVLEAARREGDAFTFDAALRALGRPAAAEEWVRLAETAFAEGRLSFAYQAFERADHQAGLEKTRHEMAAAGIQPATP